MTIRTRLCGGNSLFRSCDLALSIFSSKGPVRVDRGPAIGVAAPDPSWPLANIITTLGSRAAIVKIRNQ